MERIDRIPEHSHDVDEIALAKMTPGEQYVSKQLSIIRQDMRWAKGMVVELNNAIVELQLEAEQIHELRVRFPRVEAMAEASDQTIKGWVTKFQSPIVMLGGLFGMAISAAIGAWVSRLFGK